MGETQVAEVLAANSSKQDLIDLVSDIDFDLDEPQFGDIVKEMNATLAEDEMSDSEVDFDAMRRLLSNSAPDVASSPTYHHVGDESQSLPEYGSHLTHIVYHSLALFSC